MNRRFEQAFTEQAKKLFSLYGAYMDCKRSAEDFKQGKGISLKPVKETIDELEKKSQMLAGQFVEAYNVFNFDLHQIWEEITTNLDEPMSDQQRERYCYSLITPFEAYNNNYRTFTGEELSTLDEIEKCLLELQTIISQYANMLDGAFVMFGLDLKQLQKKCGMELKRYWGGDVAMSMRAFDISKYVGTMTLAQEYLSRLPEPEEQPEPQQGAQEQQGVQQKGEVHLPDVLNTQKTKAIFDEAIKRKWMQPNGNGCYRWLGLNGYERGKQQQLVYMIGQMYGYKKGLSGNEGNYIPCKALEGLFEVSGIYSRLIKCWEAKPQSWRQAIDDMIATALQNNTASTSN